MYELDEGPMDEMQSNSMHFRPSLPSKIDSEFQISESNAFWLIRFGRYLDLFSNIFFTWGSSPFFKIILSFKPNAKCPSGEVQDSDIEASLTLN